MRRNYRVLLMLILAAVFSPAPSFAAAKLYGQYHLQGWYEKNHSLIDQDSTSGPANRGSTAFYTERLRMGIDYMIVPGLMFGTRADMLDHIVDVSIRDPGYAASLSEQENIGLEIAYLMFDTPIGRWTVGLSTGGTSFETDLESGTSKSIIWAYPSGPWLLMIGDKKGTETTGIGCGTDGDSDTYQLIGQYKWERGLMYFRFSDVHSRTNNHLPINSYTGDLYCFTPIFKHKFGIFAFEWEINFVTGWQKKYNETPPAGSYNIRADNAVNSRMQISANLSPVRLGAYFIYNQGDDPYTLDSREGTFRQLLDYDRTFNPCLILWNEDYLLWLGGNTIYTGNSGMLSGNAGSKGVRTNLDNVWMYQVNGDYNATSKLKLSVSFTYAYADKKPTMDMTQPVSAANPLFVGKKYGSELDFILKYKIYNNLEYMIGAAYLWTGDYFKGTDPNTRLANDYLLTHKLTLKF